MYGELYEFLLQHKKLPLPGIGTFILERMPAQVDFPNRKVMPPVFSVSMQNDAVSPSRIFLNWLAGRLHISERDAILKFNDFTYDLKRQLNEGKTIHWTGVGTLIKSMNGDYRFASSIKDHTMEQPVHAEKVIRLKEAHRVRVGEEVKSSFEMMQRLKQIPMRRSFRWLITMVVMILALVFAIIYFSRHASILSSSANRQKVVPEESNTSSNKVP